MDGKNKFWKGVLIGALVTAFAGLIVIGIAAGIWVVGKGVMGNQTVGISDGRATPSEVSLDIDRISQKMELIQGIISENYLFEEDPEMVEDGIFMGMMAGLGDPYSTYYTEEDFQELMENSIEGEYCGIGARISQNRGTMLMTVIRVFEGTPCAEAGMLPGDVITAVNGENVTAAELRQLGALLLDIHGQNDGRQLMDETRHRDYLDGFAGLAPQLERQGRLYEEYRQALSALRKLEMTEAERERREREYRMTADELAAANIRPGEEEQLLARRELLRNSEKLTEALDAAYERNADLVCAALDGGKDVAFITLGDPTVYSTYLYLHKKVVARGYDAQIIPGVPSFCAVAAKLNMALCEKGERLLIVPASHKDVSDCLDLDANLVFMKAGKEIGALKNTLEEHGLLGRASLVANCGMEGELVCPRFADLEEGSGYFSVVLVKKGEEA